MVSRRLELLVWEASDSGPFPQLGYVRLFCPGGEKAATFPCRPGAHTLCVTRGLQQVNQPESLLLGLKRPRLLCATRPAGPPRLRRAGISVIPGAWGRGAAAGGAGSARRALSQPLNCLRLLSVPHPGSALLGRSLCSAFGAMMCSRSLMESCGAAVQGSRRRPRLLPARSPRSSGQADSSFHAQTPPSPLLCAPAPRAVTAMAAGRTPLQNWQRLQGRTFLLRKATAAPRALRDD